MRLGKTTVESPSKSSKKAKRAAAKALLNISEEFAEESKIQAKENLVVIDESPMQIPRKPNTIPAPGRQCTWKYSCILS